MHAIAAALRRNVDIYTLCSDFYSIEALRSTYSETIYPCSNEDEWEIPHELKTLHVGVPEAPMAKASRKATEEKETFPRGTYCDTAQVQSLWMPWA